jgi:hypothetical protein
VEESQNNHLHLISIVQQAINEQDLYKKIRLTHIILHCIEIEEHKKQITQFHHYLEELNENVVVMRKLLLNSKIKEQPETAIFYLGKDYLGSDEDMIFNTDFEIFLANLLTRTEEFLGLVLQNITQQEEDISFSN